jgi:hypothetical protein
MHDGKRPKWRKQSQGVAHRPCRSRGKISRFKRPGGLHVAIAPSAGEKAAQDELNTTQKCSSLSSRHFQANKRRFNGNSQALQELGRESRHDNDLNVEVCSKLPACSLSNQSRLRQFDSLRRLCGYLTHGPRRRSSLQSSLFQVFDLVLGSGPFICCYCSGPPSKDILDAVWKLFHHLFHPSTSSPRPLHPLHHNPQQRTSPFGLQHSQPAYINLVLAVDSHLPNLSRLLRL